MQFTIVAKNIDKAASDLDGMGQRATHARPAFDLILDALIDNEKSIWSRNGGSGKAKWTNTDSTLASKIAKGLDKRPMRATGALEKSLTEKGAPHQLHEQDEFSLLFGTTLFYAKFNQLAKDPHRKKVVLKLLPKTKKTIRETILEHITQGL